MICPNVVNVWQLGQTTYDTSQKIQEALVKRHLDRKKEQEINYDTILLMEHKPVYTAGIRDEPLSTEISRLSNLGADFRKANRGGQLTFHGPGQLVVYPVIDLTHFRTSVKWYIDMLEETVIALCRQLGVKANRSPYTGVWVDDNKIAAIGINAYKYITSHGIALNCDNDLAWFDHIDPCGMGDKGVTSLSKETGKHWTVDKVTPLLVKNFTKIFECKSEQLDVKIQEEILKSIFH